MLKAYLSLLFIGFGNPKMHPKRVLWHARPDGSHGRPDGQPFTCPESNSEIFYRAVRTGNYFRPTGGRTDSTNGCPDSRFTARFLSFPMTLISSQSDIGVKSYDQNTRGCPDGLTERPDGQLQPPFQSSTESFHNKAASGRYFPSVRTVALRMHEITKIRLGPSGP
jgi:hypothetical protein